MAIKADLHLHSSFSGDSEASMESMVEKAISLGLEHICFTEHMDFDYPINERTPFGYFDLNTDSYLFDLLKYRGRYKDHIKVHFGVELGLQSYLAEEQMDFSASKPFDFIIGSSHLLDRDDPYWPEYWEGLDEEKTYRRYFSSIIENLEDTLDIDVYGHIDYIVRYGPNKDKFYTYEKYREELEYILDLLVEKGIGLEINTGGLGYGLKELHPSREILTRYREKGGQIITIGSDAHRPEDMARSFARAEELLKECGFKYYSVFEKRNPYFYKL